MGSAQLILQRPTSPRANNPHRVLVTSRSTQEACCPFRFNRWVFLWYMLWRSHFLDTRFIVVTLIKLDLMILYKETHQWQRQKGDYCECLQPTGARQIIGDLSKDKLCTVNTVGLFCYTSVQTYTKLCTCASHVIHFFPHKTQKKDYKIDKYCPKAISFFFPQLFFSAWAVSWFLDVSCWSGRCCSRNVDIVRAVGEGQRSHLLFFRG